MAKVIILESQAINKIHSMRQGVDGQVYRTIEGDEYIGLPSGFLRREQQTRGEIGGTSLKSGVKSIGKYSRKEVLSLLDEVANNNWATNDGTEKAIEIAIEAAKKETKCFSIAMSVAL